MWLLVATICIVADPVTVNCATEAVKIERTRSDCTVLLLPMEAYLRGLLDEAKIEPVFLNVACKSGDVI